MTKLELRQQEIEKLAAQVIEKAQTKRSGSACLVPSGSEPGRWYRVDIDENYVPYACTCQGGRRDCKHRQAVWLYFAPKLRALRNKVLNPVYQFYRAGQLVRARLSQFSKAEKAAFREQERLEADARRRDEYVQNFDPCMLAAA